MTVATTSREAFETVRVTARQGDVLRALEALSGPTRKPTDQDIAAHLGWTINRVTGRRGELEALGLVVRGGLTVGKAGRRMSWWRPVHKWEQMTLFQAIDRSERARRRP